MPPLPPPLPLMCLLYLFFMMGKVVKPHPSQFIKNLDTIHEVPLAASSSRHMVLA